MLIIYLKPLYYFYKALKNDARDRWRRRKKREEPFLSVNDTDEGEAMSQCCVT